MAALSRRRVLQGWLGCVPGLHGESANSIVAIARDPRARASQAQVAHMLDRAVQALYHVDSPAEAWKRVARRGEVVGLKVNCLAGRGASTSVTFVEAVCERLQQAGIPARDIVIWDRLNVDLESAGFQPSNHTGRIRVLGNDELGYGGDLAISGHAGSLLARTLTQVCDAVINLPVLKDHGIVGVSVALKNLFGAIHNPNKYHIDCGNPYVADVYMFPPIRQKVRLHLCDAVVAQYEGGPSYMPQWSWPMNAVMAAFDPVALDYTGWQLIEQKRAEKGMQPLKALKREPAYIATAADSAHRLGTCDPARITRLEV